MTTSTLTERGAGPVRAGRAVALILVVLVAVAGCGRERAAPSPAAKAPAPGTAAPEAAATTPAAGTAPERSAPAAGGEIAVADNNLAPSAGEIPFASREAGFAAVFPAGCPTIRTRVIPAGRRTGPPDIVQCFCDLSGRKNEGVMVATYLALRDERGGPPNPRNVTALIGELTNQYQLMVVRQVTVIHPDYEGVRAFCRDASGQGEMWVQGMLAGDRVFIMTAWRLAAGGLTDEQAIRFFDSFRLQS